MNPTTCALLLSTSWLAAGAYAQADDVATLRRVHEQALDAHRRNDVAALLENLGDNFVDVSRGDVQRPSRDALTQMFTEYLGSTRFDVYRDITPPVVRVSDDGSLGWVIAHVEVSGVQRRGDQAERPFAFVSSWVALYAKRDGRWWMVGNASGIRPQDPPGGS